MSIWLNMKTNLKTKTLPVYIKIEEGGAYKCYAENPYRRIFIQCFQCSSVGSGTVVGGTVYHLCIVCGGLTVGKVEYV